MKKSSFLMSDLGSVTYRELISTLQLLNPNVVIKYDVASKKIRCDISLSQLVLPNHFYINGNTITNQYHTPSETFLSLQVESLPKQQMILPQGEREI